MIVDADALAARDLALLARMHVESLPESLVSRIGERYARAFYRYLARSSRELVLLHRDAGDIAAACIVSLEPETLSRRLLLRTPLALHAPFAVHRLPVRKLLGGGPASPPQPPGPEILLIFTIASARSRGLGLDMVARTEAVLCARGHTRLLVKTRDDPANRALAFYPRAGFTRLGRIEKLGKALVLFDKQLHS